MSLDFYLHTTRKCGQCTDYVFQRNITHNLTAMADAAGIYEALWHPERLEQVKTAKDLIPLLIESLAKLKSDPKKFEQYNASNAWGKYEHFVPFVEEVLKACQKYPEAAIETST